MATIRNRTADKYERTSCDTSQGVLPDIQRKDGYSRTSSAHKHSPSSQWTTTVAMNTMISRHALSRAKYELEAQSAEYSILSACARAASHT